MAESETGQEEPPSPSLDAPLLSPPPPPPPTGLSKNSSGAKLNSAKGKGFLGHLWYTNPLDLLAPPPPTSSKTPPPHRCCSFLMRNAEKRTITSPITDSDGNISLFQLLWKGTTDLCSGNCWIRHFAKFRSGSISHSGPENHVGKFRTNLKREISHGEIFPPQSIPPPPCTTKTLFSGRAPF